MDKPHFSREQKEYLLHLVDECQAHDTLAPLFALIYISDEPLTEYELQRGQDLADAEEALKEYVPGEGISVLDLLERMRKEGKL